LPACCSRIPYHSSPFLLRVAATTQLYTLSLHDALPISPAEAGVDIAPVAETGRSYVENAVAKATAYVRSSGLPALADDSGLEVEDRKSTRLNSSHVKISYAVFCLKKKKIM